MKTILGYGRVWLWEALKLQMEICYRAGWLIGFMAGTYGIYHEPTPEEMRSTDIMLEAIERFRKDLEDK